MSSLLQWLDEKPAATVEVPLGHPTPDVRWPSGHSTAEVIALAAGLERELFQAINESGDAADQALQLVQRWRTAIAQHPKYGRNWLGAHRDELVGLLRTALPNLIPTPQDERELEGMALASCVTRVFPGAYKGLDVNYMKLFYGLGVLNERKGGR